MTSALPDQPPPYGYGPTPPYDDSASYWSMPDPGWGAPRPSQAMAIWALVLSCLFFIPIAPLVGVALAIAVIARSGPVFDFGRTKAIIALVIGVLVLMGWVALIVVLALTGGTTSGPAAEIGPGRTVSWDQLAVGDCFDQSAALTRGASRQVQSVEVVPCAGRHEFEIYARFDLPEASYPGKAAAEREAGAGCDTRFTSFVGVPAAHSSLFYVSLYSTARGWGEGHHEVRCAVGPGGSRTVSGTVHGSKK